MTKKKYQILFNTDTGEKITDPEKIDIVLKDATRIHFYCFENLLNPRGGSMEKESFSLHVYEYLDKIVESWTDPRYGDRVEIETVLDFINKEAHKELKVAIAELEEKYLRSKA